MAEEKKLPRTSKEVEIVWKGLIIIAAISICILIIVGVLANVLV